MFVLKDQATNFTNQMANRTAIIRAAQNALIAPSSTVATTTTTKAAGRKKREEEENEEIGMCCYPKEVVAPSLYFVWQFVDYF